MCVTDLFASVLVVLVILTKMENASEIMVTKVISVAMVTIIKCVTIDIVTVRIGVMLCVSAMLVSMEIRSPTLQ